MKTPPPQSFDQIAELYDDDMGRNPSGADIAYYVRACQGSGGPVLELGCGTGRVTLPLVRAGCRVCGIDTSAAMLRVLERKAAADLAPAERRRLHSVCADMRDFRSAERFASILCPFSTFPYLVEEADQLATLETVRALLAPGGHFLLDLFVPDPALSALPDGEAIHDYRRERADGTFLERSKWKTRVANEVNAVTRQYRFLDASGIEKVRFATTDLIRSFTPVEVERLLRKSGFEIVEAQEDFTGQPISPQARVMVFACQRIE